MKRQRHISCKDVIEKWLQQRVKRAKILNRGSIRAKPRTPLPSNDAAPLFVECGSHKQCAWAPPPTIRKAKHSPKPRYLVHTKT
jgi:hypothetical protein